MNRRQFLTRAIPSAAALALAGPEILTLTRKIFLPPRGGWPGSIRFQRGYYIYFETNSWNRSVSISDIARHGTRVAAVRGYRIHHEWNDAQAALAAAGDLICPA